MTAVERLIEEHRQAVGEALERGWGPWRLMPGLGLVRAVGSVHHIVGFDAKPASLAEDVTIDAYELGHLLNALRDCAYAKAIGAGPWAKDSDA